MQTQSKYEIVEKLGCGPRATVYRGRHLALGVNVAIKELYPLLSPRTKKSLFTAVDRWAQASHEQLLAVRDVDVSRDWIITELMHGSFADAVRAEAIAPARVRDVLIQSLTALDFLHSRHNCLHANIKPSNLLYDDSGHVRLSDGYAIAIGPGIELPAPTESCKYLAPEMLGEGAEQIGPAADLYSLGFVMLELLIGQRFNSLFRGISEDPQDIDRAWVRWHSTRAESAPRVADQVAGVPRDLALVIDRLVCKDIVQRYCSAGDALKDLTSAAPPATEFPELEFAAAVAPLPPAAAYAEIAPPPSIAPGSPATPGFAAAFAPSAPLSPPAADAEALVPRPATPVVLWLISGPRGGEMVGLDGHEICVGDGDPCHLRFSPEQYPGVSGRRIRLRCDADGWVVRSEGADGLIVNHRLVDSVAPIRSGDIIRMSIAGPDFQFLLQNPGDPSLVDVAGVLLASHPSSVVPVEEKAPAHWAPTGPAAPAWRGPVADSAPAPPLPLAAVAPPSPPSPPLASIVPAAQPAYAPSPPGASAALADGRDSPRQPFDWKKLLDYKRWDKKTQNWVVALISSIIALIVVYLVPVGGGSGRSKTTPRQQPAVVRPAAHTATADPK